MSSRNRMARFNRMFANRIFGPVLTRFPGFGTVHHRGRKSGREYHTPVKLFRRGKDIVITLPYGSNSDWVRNVLAAGGCDLTTRGRRITLTNPTVFTDDGTVAIPAVLRMVLSRLDVTEFIALTPADDRAAAPD
jgi:deazaflavin-dependent oxidoreductase (nitroreductase family)